MQIPNVTQYSSYKSFLRTFMKKNKLSIRQFAKLVDVKSYSFLFAILTDEYAKHPSPQTLLKIIRLMGFDINQAYYFKSLVMIDKTDALTYKEKLRAVLSLKKEVLSEVSSM